MSESNSASLVVVLAVIAVILINLLLAYGVLTRTKRKDSSTYSQMVNLFKSARNPFETTDAELDELTNLVEKIKNQTKSPEENSSQPE